jgi:hypothetical protein
METRVVNKICDLPTEVLGGIIFFMLLNPDEIDGKNGHNGEKIFNLLCSISTVCKKFNESVEYVHKVFLIGKGINPSELRDKKPDLYDIYKYKACLIQDINYETLKILYLIVNQEKFKADPITNNDFYFSYKIRYLYSACLTISRVEPSSRAENRWINGITDFSHSLDDSLHVDSKDKILANRAITVLLHTLHKKLKISNNLLEVFFKKVNDLNIKFGSYDCSEVITLAINNDNNTLNVVETICKNLELFINNRYKLKAYMTASNSGRKDVEEIKGIIVKELCSEFSALQLKFFLIYHRLRKSKNCLLSNCFVQRGLIRLYEIFLPD